MDTKIVKYNPSFLNDQELIESFVVRQSSLELLMDVVRENTHENNQHLLVIGPRGSGKTTLLRRVIAEIRQTPELDAVLFPLPFGEESYEVASAGEFWLEAIHHMSELTGDSSWIKAHAELLQEPDDKRLQQRCLARLMDFADKCGKRLLLVVENLNLMLGEQLEDHDAWSLRNTLMHESRLMLLGSATNHFDAINDQNQAMFELFRVIEISRLTVQECQKVWNRVAGHPITEEQARAIQILTGGNPRLLTILSVFGANRSFCSLMDDLSLLVDEHTDYFKSNIESLPTMERKVFACLASLWEDSLSCDVAKASRMTTNKVSAQLNRLVKRGAVKVVSEKSGKKRYQLAERLYNIYYLMRRGQNSGRVQAVVHFMRQFYGQERLHEAVEMIAREACGMKEGERHELFQAIRMVYDCPEARGMQDRLRESLPQAFLELSDIPDNVKLIFAPGMDDFEDEVLSLSREIEKMISDERWKEAEKAMRKVMELIPEFAKGWASLGVLLTDELDQPEEGVICFRKVVELDSDNARGWGVLGETLVNKLDQSKEGESCLRRAVELDSDDARVWGALGDILANKLDQPKEGESCLRRASKLDPNEVQVWSTLGHVLVSKLDQPEEGATCLRRASELDPNNVQVWGRLGSVLANKLGQLEEGVKCLRKVVELEPDNILGWRVLGSFLAYKLDQPEEGVNCFRKVIELDPNDTISWIALGNVLADNLGQPEEGASCLYKAVELDPDNALSWRLLGEAFVYNLDKSEEGVACLRKVVELDSDNANAWSLLGYILIFNLGECEEGYECLRRTAAIDPDLLDKSYLLDKIRTGTVSIATIEDILNCTGRPGGLLNAVACSLMDAESYEDLETIEKWARESVEKIGDKGHCHGTLAKILALRGKVSESLSHASIVLEHPEIVNIDIQEATDILTTAAALGHAQESLDILLASPSLSVLEPVAAGLKQYLGLDVQAPQEVREIGEDIVKRIEHWKEWHADRN